MKDNAIHGKILLLWAESTKGKGEKTLRKNSMATAFLLVLQHLIIQHINSYPQKQSTNLKLIIYILSIYAMLQSSTVGT